MIALRKKKEVNPLKFGKILWPDVYFYKEQRDIVQSVWRDDETVVPAGNMLGKDFVAGRIVVLYFLTHYPCRIVTTSAKDDHLRVLWGEIDEAIRNSTVPLSDQDGGPLVCTHREIKRKYKSGNHINRLSPKCYVRGMVASSDTIASLQGHHAKYTLFVCDESSSVMDEYFKMANGWAKRKLIIGNPWPCSNYFFRAVEGDPATNEAGGDIENPSHPGTYYRKIIRIRAEDSPNIRLAIAQKARGKEPTGEVLVPGVKDYNEYLKNRALWDEVQQTVSLDAEFPKSGKVLLFPEVALKRCIEYARTIKDMKRRAKTMGVDAAEGGDSSVWTIVDYIGIVYQLSLKTPDTSEIVGKTIGLMREFHLEPSNVLFDRGGGGKQHVDQLRRRGYDVRTVGFGEAATDPHRHRKTATGRAPTAQRVETGESGYIYKNRRAEMYGIASQLVCASHRNFAIPSTYGELTRQLKLTPKMYDGEGRMYLPPKDKPNPDYKGQTLKQMIGRSPDEADSFVLAVYGMMKPPVRVIIGAA